MKHDLLGIWRRDIENIIIKKTKHNTDAFMHK